jgi:hypothetical protein
MESKRHLAKCACVETRVAPVNTIDNYFKKIVTDVEAVNVRLDVVVANIVEVKEEINITLASLATELAEVKVALNVKNEYSILLSENEMLKHANEALRIELEHVRETSLLQIENAVLKAQLEQPRTYKEPKEPKIKEIKAIVVQEDPEVVKERKITQKLIEDEAVQLRKRSGESLINYWVTHEHVDDDNVYMPAAHLELRTDSLQKAVNEMCEIEVDDINALKDHADRIINILDFTGNPNRIRNIMARHIYLRKFNIDQHKKFIQEVFTFVSVNSSYDDDGENKSKYVQKSIDRVAGKKEHKIAHKKQKTSEYVENRGKPSAEVVEPKHLTESYLKQQRDAHQYAADERAAYDEAMTC